MYSESSEAGESRMPRDPELWRAALHESGHAIVLVHFRKPIHRVRLFPGPGRHGMRGCVERHPDPLNTPKPQSHDPAIAAAIREDLRKLPASWHREKRESVLMEELLAYSGIACEDPVSPGWGIDPHLFASSSDDRAGLRLELALVDWKRRDYCDVTLRRTQRFVDPRWGSVRAIAEPLYDRLELSGAEVYALVESAPIECNPLRVRDWSFAVRARVSAEWARDANLRARPGPSAHA